MNRLGGQMLQVGKLPQELLGRLLARYTGRDERLVVGPAIGVDATVIDFGDRYLVAKTDPITFVAEEIGYYAVVINANDVACMGARPRWFLATILLPEHGADYALAEKIFAQLADACAALEVVLCGGHTEITTGLDRPIVVGQMLGEVSKERLVSSAGLRPGDHLILTKGVPIEGGSIIARERGQELSELFGRELVERCRNLIFSPGISVVRDVAIACDAGTVHALHDPTEGGLLTGLWEMATASSVGLEIDEQRIPILPECKILCDQYGLDPLGTIASGALLIGAPGGESSRIVAALQAAGIEARVIGRAVEAERGLVMRRGDELVPLSPFAQDEIAKLFC
ncbi:MAG: AIR synthase family protein [candidate division KSB1 bacterium]|nr:AIR synthase family protein [candidate division KSB1 bacterium]MDZ7386078.1 AIR synthase family protein [candidate division KSB1 bacterium]MDZ7391341.1 AIR synthase family protein [candidate division KSB1 bacterium]